MAKEKKSKLKKNVRVYVGIALLVLSTFCFIPLFTGLISPIKYFLLGTFGLFAYPIFILTFVIGLALVNRKKYVMPVKYILFLTFAIVSILAVIQMAIMHNFEGGFFDFLGNCYTRQLTPGGIIIGLFIAPIKFTLNNIGVYCIYSILFVVFVWLIVDFLVYIKKNADKGKVVKLVKKQKQEQPKKEILKEKEIKKVKEIQPVKNEKKGDWIIDSDGNLVGREGEHITTLSKLDKAIEKRKQKEEKPKITLDAKIEEEQESSETSAKRRLGLIKSGVIETSSNIVKEPHF